MCNRLRPNPFPNLDGGRSVACLGGATASIGHRVLRRRHVRRTVVRSRRAESLQPVASCNGAIRAGTGGLLAAGRRQYVVGDWAGGVHGRGWFLWGTGIFTAGEQSRLAAEFQERLLAISDLTALPLGDGASAAASEIVIPVAWDDPVIQVASTISAELEAIPDLAGVIPELAPQPGAALGRIMIPKAEIDWIVVEGVTPEDLRNGPGHIRGSAMPGQVGNTVISGHRTTNGAPFYHLDRLERGDTITVESLTGAHTYQVVETRIVQPDDTWVATQWEGSWL